MIDSDFFKTIKRFFCEKDSKDKNRKTLHFFKFFLHTIFIYKKHKNTRRCKNG